MESKKIEDEKLKRYNSKLISLFLFQYTILIPAMIFVNSVILVGLFSLGILAFAIMRNRRLYINPRILLFSLAIFLLILIKTIIYQDGGYSVMIQFLSIACPALYIISLPFDKKQFLETSYRLSVISFFLIFWVRFVDVGINYMRFGYGMAPIVVFLYCELVYQKDLAKKKRFLLMALLLISVTEIIVFGARGSMVPIIIMVILDKLIINKIRGGGNMREGKMHFFAARCISGWKAGEHGLRNRSD